MQYCPDTSCPCGNLGLVVTETAPTGDSYFCESCGQEHTETAHERQERLAPDSTPEVVQPQVSSFHQKLEQWPGATVRNKPTKRNRHEYMGSTPSLEFKVVPNKGKRIRIKLKKLEIDGLVPQVDVIVHWDFPDPSSGICIPTKLGGYDLRPVTLKASFVPKGAVAQSNCVINPTKAFAFYCRSDEEMLEVLKEVERIAKPLYEEASLINSSEVAK